MIVALTQAGRKKASEIGGSSTAHNILYYLKESGPVSVEELADEVDLEGDELLSVLSKLKKKGLIAVEGG